MGYARMSDTTNMMWNGEGFADQPPFGEVLAIEHPRARSAVHTRVTPAAIPFLCRHPAPPCNFRWTLSMRTCRFISLP